MYQIVIVIDFVKKAFLNRWTAQTQRQAEITTEWSWSSCDLEDVKIRNYMLVSDGKLLWATSSCSRFRSWCRRLKSQWIFRCKRERYDKRYKRELAGIGTRPARHGFASRKLRLLWRPLIEPIKGKCLRDAAVNFVSLSEHCMSLHVLVSVPSVRSYVCVSVCLTRHTGNVLAVAYTS